MPGMLSTMVLLAAGVASMGLHDEDVPHVVGLAPRDDNVSTRRILVGSAGQIVGFSYDGGIFTPSPYANVSEPGRTASWLAFKSPDLLYAVDESSNATRLFHYDPSTGSLSSAHSSFTGSSGVVHLAFNTDRTRLVGSSYGQGQLDVWDASSGDGSLQLLKQVALGGTREPNSAHPTQARAHQAVLDPSGRFFLVNDLGGDAIHVLDTHEDAFSIVGTTAVTPAASGPRHGAFIALTGTSQATHYVVVCERSNTLQLFGVTYDNDTLGLTGIQTISSYGPGLGPANMTSAAAGELVVSRGGPVFIYVSNRFSGNETDSISRFALEAQSDTDPTPQLVFKGCVSSGGIAPRMFGFSQDGNESVVYVTNMDGVNALAATARDKTTGAMATEPLGLFPNDRFSLEARDAGFGPQFVMEI